MGNMAVLKKRVNALILHPDRRIERREMDVQGRMMWGRKEGDNRLAYITPPDVRSLEGKPTVILTQATIKPVSLPGFAAYRLTSETLRRICTQRHFQVSASRKSQNDPTRNLLILNLVIGGLTFVVIAAFALMMTPILLERLPWF